MILGILPSLGILSIEMINESLLLFFVTYLLKNNKNSLKTVLYLLNQLATIPNVKSSFI